MARLRVLIAHPDAARGRELAQRLAAVPAIELAEPVRDSPGLCAAARALGPGCVIVVADALLDALDPARDAAQARWLALCHEAGARPIARALQAGAHGCLVEGDDEVELSRAVAALAAGRAFLGPTAATCIASLYRCGSPDSRASGVSIWLSAAQAHGPKEGT